MLNHKEKCTADIYAAIWDADIPWTREQVKQLPKEILDTATFYTYKQMVARPDSNAGSSQNTDDNDDDSKYSNKQCSNRELLLVSWLLDRDDVDTANLLQLYTQHGLTHRCVIYHYVSKSGI